MGAQSRFVVNTTVATVLLIGFYGLRSLVQFPAILLPSYPLRGGIVLVESIFGRLEVADPVVLVVYLFVLGFVGTAVSSAAHRLTVARTSPTGHLGVASALGIVGIHWMEFAVTFYDTTHTDTRAIVLTGVSGLIALGIAIWLAGTTQTPSGDTSTPERDDV